MRLLKTVSLALAAVLLAGAFAALSVSASAEKKYESMLVVGDSISTGYGLENYTPGGSPYECRSYCNILAESLELKGGESYINRAVNGYTSSDLLALIPSLKEQVAKSDLVVISIGGNDLLHIAPKVVEKITGTPVGNIQEAAGAILKADKATLDAALTRTDISTLLFTTVASYSANVVKIMSAVHEYNPSARVIFLAQYNPMNNVPEAGAFGGFAGTVIDSLNVALRVAVAGAGFGYEVADIPSVIDPNADGYTNIVNMDIHPNAEGHKLMGEYMINLVGSDPQPVTTREETTPAAPETSTEPEKTTAAAPETTAAPVTETPETTAAPAKKGCGSFVGAWALIAVAAGALCITKKRKK